jgi:exopolyphosphatase/guanosine-5'-triphosphate,3'-diphosphate pyrophosphatase
MPLGVVDVGANTVRLLVKSGDDVIHRRRAMLRLGEAVELYGAIPDAKLTEAATTVAAFVIDGRAHGAERVEVLITSPGRQASNGEELIERIASACGAPVRVLSSEEEGQLGFQGALNALRVPPRESLAVVDVGGGSAQIAIGTKRDGATWVRSIDLGSMRLTSRLLQGDPPGADAMVAARKEVTAALAGIEPPFAEEGRAVGGSARALRELTGPVLTHEALRQAQSILTYTPHSELVDVWNIEPDRVPTLAAGTVILSALQELVGIPLRVRRGGLRDGALAELEHRVRASRAA